MKYDEDSFAGEGWFVGVIVALILLAVGYLVFAPEPLIFRSEVVVEMKVENSQ